MKRYWKTSVFITLAIISTIGTNAYTTDISSETSSCGSLQAIAHSNQPKGFCPLKHTQVSAEIAGFIGRVTVIQEFTNPYEEPIEAIYTFPLSDRGAVDTMTMKIGERTIKGVIKKREEARKIYEEAKTTGKTASLLDQERPNIFTQSVANIMPGENIQITISYVEYLKYEAGEYELSFPMVIGPRYNPAAPDKPNEPDPSRVPDANRITPPVTPEGTRAGHDIELSVNVDAGVPLHDIHSELHEIDVEGPNDSKAIIRLKNQKEIPNRDFVLKYKVAGESIQDAVLTHTNAKGGFFTLILQPPERVAPEMVTPKEMIFVIDSSGSMQGFPIEKAKTCMRLCIEGMNPADTFNLVSFSGGTGYCFPNSVPNTPENRQHALAYLDALEGQGGTEMMKAIHAALGGPADSQRLRVVCFMTDGFIGNDMEILSAIKDNVKTSRVFAFGIGNGVNRFLIEGMAKEGRGASEIITLEGDGTAAAKRFHERIQTPVLTDITVDFGTLPVEAIYPDPKAIPDLFSAQPIIMKGRYHGSGKGDVVIQGKTAAGPFTRTIEVTLPAEAPTHDILAPLWARTHIDDLMAKDWLGIQRNTPDTKIKDEITQLGLDFNLVTQFTSFVAVEEKVANEGGKTKTVEVPVEMTDGVSYKGVYGDSMATTPNKAMNSIDCTAFRSTPSSAPSEDIEIYQSYVEVGKNKPTPTKAEPAPPASPQKADLMELLKQRLDAELWTLVDTGAVSTTLKIVDDWVHVQILLTEDTQEKLDALKAAGADIISHAASGKKVLAKVKTDDLKTIASLDFIKRVEHARF